MCEEPDFDLPGSFMDAARRLDLRGKGGGVMVMPDADARAMLDKIAGQTGFSAEAVATGLLYEALSTFRNKGFIF